jgi:hypothetical protein
MSSDSRARYDAVAAELIASLDAQPGMMFGMPCLKYHSKAFAGFAEDAMVFKLAGPTHAAALALAGAHVFDPSGRGRPMRAWVVVPRAHTDRWPEFGRAALAALADTP